MESIIIVLFIIGVLYILFKAVEQMILFIFEDNARGSNKLPFGYQPKKTDPEKKVIPPQSGTGEIKICNPIREGMEKKGGIKVPPKDLPDKPKIDVGAQNPEKIKTCKTCKWNWGQYTMTGPGSDWPCDNCRVDRWEPKEKE